MTIELTYLLTLICEKALLGCWSAFSGWEMPCQDVRVPFQGVGGAY